MYLMFEDKETKKTLGLKFKDFWCMIMLFIIIITFEVINFEIGNNTLLLRKILNKPTFKTVTQEALFFKSSRIL